MLIFGGSSCQVLGKEVSDGLGADLGRLTVKKFPDGELFLRVESEVKGEDVVVVQSVCRPHNDNLVEMLLLLDTLRDLGAGKITTVVPYYGYGRQDRRFEAGEALSAKVVAKHIQLNSDEFVTINPHETHVLDFFDIPAMELDATPLLGKYYEAFELDCPLIIAPDKSALALAEGISKGLNTDCNHLEKARLAPCEVETESKDVGVKGRDVIIVDDMIDSGGTILEALKILKDQGAGDVYIGCVHPILTGNVVTTLFSNGAVDVVGTNTLGSQVSFVTVAPLLIDALG